MGVATGRQQHGRRSRSLILRNNYDPIARGYVQSLARPGGNVTGIVTLQLEVVAKQIELLVEAFPERKRLGVLWDAQSADQFAVAERETKARQLALRAIKMENPPYDFALAFRALAQDGVQMLPGQLSSPLLRAAKRGDRARLPSSIGCRASSSSSITSRRAG